MSSRTCGWSRVLHTSICRINRYEVKLLTGEEHSFRGSHRTRWSCSRNDIPLKTFIATGMSPSQKPLQISKWLHGTGWLTQRERDTLCTMYPHLPEWTALSPSSVHSPFISAEGSAKVWDGLRFLRMCRISSAAFWYLTVPLLWSRSCYN